jgi:putative salt-induced outer membrane protein YdiY
MRKRVGWAVRAIVFLLLSATVWPDCVFLTNGDRISGRIVQLQDGTLTIESSYAGTIAIDWRQVVSLQTESPVSVWWPGGQEVCGRLVQAATGSVELRPESGEAQILCTTEILRVGSQPPAWATEEARAPGRPEWSGSLAMTLGIREGAKASTLDFYSSAKATRRTENRELLLGASGGYGETEGETTQSEYTLRSEYRVDRGERLFYFGQLLGQHDDMEDLNLRLDLTAGEGWRFWERDSEHLIAKIGVGGSREFYQGDRDQSDFNGYLGLSWASRIHRQIRLSQDVEFFPGLSDLGDFRLRSETGLSTPFREQWSLFFHVLDEYVSDPGGEADNNDLAFRSGISYDF